ncbi:pyridoxal phosphate-dependent decarboxylase family protein [Lysobacter panacisoli]|uniref:Pyridoxal-dependent decarboxylase n=1 Tax=Lysobacter panacisoli TaxID=1255263 RepID=A0ABP9L6X6_9GAMM|nr:pyridoxal-dependent decarboxylase [Lysobacter panacisoli]
MDTFRSSPPPPATPVLSPEALHACFLGPYGENDTLLEKLVVEFLRDHVYWRRNFHPEDPPAIPTAAAQHPAYQALEANMRRELHSLSAALKRSVPFHSPRYIGHMASDLLLPGLAAQLLTLPYNPNNVCEDAAPVTVELEVKVGLQLARMLGYPADPDVPGCAFGHLTSGGTVANYQALRLALALKAFPVALRAAGVGVAIEDVRGLADDWQAFNVGVAPGIALVEGWQRWLATLSPEEAQRWRSRVQAERIETLGLTGFFSRHPTLRVPRVYAPVTAHYSWSKGLKLLGLGRAQLSLLPERDMRLDADALDEALDECRRTRQPVLMAVGVLGTTEHGMIDPIDRIVAARDRSQAQGLGFSVHVDAAWGGYLATMFRNPDGSLRSRAEVAQGLQSFPSECVHAAFAAVGRTDSVTVDPHKLGYLPYGAGAFVCRDNRAMTLLSEEADYVFNGLEAEDYMTRFRQLGQYIPEGSKAGASAAAVYVMHQVLPLDHARFGQLPRQTVAAAEAFRRGAERVASELSDVARVCVPFEPDSNLVCLALNLAGNRDIGRANRFVRTLHDDLRCDPSRPLQVKEFFGSMTTLRPASLGQERLARILAALDLDPETMGAGDDHVVILRHTLMNPYLIDAHNGISYIDRYFDYLASRIRTLARAS